MAESKEKIRDFFDGYSKLIQTNGPKKDNPSVPQYEMFRLNENQQIEQIEKFKQKSYATQGTPQADPQPEPQPEPQP